MGRAVDAAGARRTGFEVVARIDRAGGDAREVTRGNCSTAPTWRWSSPSPDAAPANIRVCAAARCPSWCGTTGWDADAAPSGEVRQRRRRRAAGGAELLARRARVHADRGGARPRRCARARIRRAPDRDASRGEEGRTVGHGARLSPGRAAAKLGRDVPITSVRTGSVPGTHELVFDAPFEQIRLVHTRPRPPRVRRGRAARRRLAGRTARHLHVARRAHLDRGVDAMTATKLTGCGTALVTPFTADRRHRRAGAPRPRRLADRRRHPLPGAVRIHGRSGDDDGRGASPRGADRRRAGERPGAGRGRRRLQRHAEGDRAVEGDGGRGRHAPAARVADVQQAAAARASSPTSGRSPKATALPIVIYNVPGTHRQQHRSPDHARPRAAPEHRRP